MKKSKYIYYGRSNRKPLKDYLYRDGYWIYYERKELRDDQGKLHSYSDKPAIIFLKDGKTFREEWYIHGKNSRDSDKGPAVIEYSEENPNQKISEEYRVSNLFHRDPCRGPTYIGYLEDRGTPFILKYHVNNNLHRLDGPAYIFYSWGQTKVEYHILGKKLDKYKYKKMAFIWNIIINIAKKIKKRHLQKVLKDTKFCSKNGDDISEIIISNMI